MPKKVLIMPEAHKGAKWIDKSRVDTEAEKRQVFVKNGANAVKAIAPDDSCEGQPSDVLVDEAVIVRVVSAAMKEVYGT